MSKKKATKPHFIKLLEVKSPPRPIKLPVSRGMTKNVVMKSKIFTKNTKVTINYIITHPDGSVFKLQNGKGGFDYSSDRN